MATPAWTASGTDDEINTATDTDTATVVVLEKCGGRTIGFWGNKNGLALLPPGNFVALTALNLRNANGTHRNFGGTVATLAADKTALATWLQNATATNMSYMLSAQLAALQLNTTVDLDTVTAGVQRAVDPGDYVYVPALNTWSSNSQGATLLGNLASNVGSPTVTAGFVNIGALKTSANNILGATGGNLVLSGNSLRKYEEALKIVIDGINNSSNIPGPGPICVKNIDFLGTYNPLTGTYSNWNDDGDGVLEPGELG